MYFLNFIEEGILNPAFVRCIGGRVEVTRRGQTWPFIELRFLTRKLEQFEQFCEQWDMKNITGEELYRVEASLEMIFQDGQLPAVAGGPSMETEDRRRPEAETPAGSSIIPLK